MSLTVTVNLKNCKSCRHIGHSGGFAPGGAKPICDHPRIVEWIKKFKPKLRDDDPNDSATMDSQQAYHWKHRVIPYKRVEGGSSRRGYYREAKGTIPQWCPLRNGEQY